MIILLLLSIYTIANAVVCDPKPGTPTLTPMGSPLGINKGRVTWNYDRDVCSWTGDKSTLWWDPKYLNYTGVDKMLSQSVLSLTGEKTLEDSWDAIFRYFNMRKFGKNVGYKKGEKIAIKLNLNVAGGYQATFAANSVSPQFFKAVIKQLVEWGGVAQEDITWMQDQFWKPPTGIGDDYPKVNLVDTMGAMDYVKKVEVDYDTMFYFSDDDVASQNTSKLPKCLTEAKGHSLAAITETGKNWFGSIYRPDITCDFHEGLPGHWCPASLHKFVNITGAIINMGGGWLPQQKMGEYNCLVDLLGHESTTYGKGLIFFADGTYGGPSQLTNASPIKFTMEPFNNDWSCSVFASQDPIGLDSVLFDFLRSEKTLEHPKQGCADNYLHESVLNFQKYHPSGEPLTEPLGVHEHFNNPIDKQYSRNLGVGDGIELIKVHEKF